LKRLQLVLFVVERTVPEHLADRQVLVGQLLQPVVVDVEVQPEHAAH